MLAVWVVFLVGHQRVHTYGFYLTSVVSDLVLLRMAQHRKDGTLLYATLEADSIKEKQVSLALTLKPHSSTFHCMSLVSPKLLFFHQRPGNC